VHNALTGVAVLLSNVDAILVQMRRRAFHPIAINGIVLKGGQSVPMYRD
jgi:hypothetical protein